MMVVCRGKNCQVSRACRGVHGTIVDACALSLHTRKNLTARQRNVFAMFGFSFKFATSCCHLVVSVLASTNS